MIYYDKICGKAFSGANKMLIIRASFNTRGFINEIK